MRTIYQLVFACFLMVGSLSAQRVISVEPSGDPANPTDIFPIIMGDTTETGERVDNNTIYELQNGVVYVTSGRIVNKAEWPLQIQAANLEDTDNKAIIARVPNTSGDFQDIGRPEGDVTFRNLWIISGERGPLEQHDWGRLRLLGEGARIIVQDCIIEKDRGGFLQIRADSLKIYIDNTIFRNGGNRRILQGNGRGVDARNFFLDTLVMRNSIVHNIQDRFFRSQGGTQPHNYVEFDRNTSFNTAGRHGFIQLGRVIEAKITNNLFINPIMLGTSPVFTDEQTQPDNEQHKVITVDTLFDNTSLTISNNNIFWTQDVIDYWASNDTVSQPPVLSSLVAQNLGADSSNAFFQEVVELASRPTIILPYVEDLYANPMAEDMFDFIVEDISLQGTPFDSGNLFDFATFDPCYPETTASATGASDGGAVGAVGFCPNLVTSTFEPTINQQLGLQVLPNPMSGQANFRFELRQAGPIQLSIHDFMGREVARVFTGTQQAGQHQFDWNRSAQLPAGMYIARLQTMEGEQAIKLVIR